LRRQRSLVDEAPQQGDRLAAEHAVHELVPDFGAVEIDELAACDPAAEVPL
jgi:hypothetical protein